LPWAAPAQSPARERPEALRHRADPRLDRLQRGHHLANALAGDVLKAAGFVDAGDGTLQSLGLGRRDLRRDALQRLAAIEDLVRRLRRVADDGIQLVGGGGDVCLGDVVDPQRRDFLLGAGNGAAEAF
jgi:hypothetical protein